MTKRELSNIAKISAFKLFLLASPTILITDFREEFTLRHKRCSCKKYLIANKFGFDTLTTKTKVSLEKRIAIKPNPAWPRIVAASAQPPEIPVTFEVLLEFLGLHSQ